MWATRTAPPLAPAFCRFYPGKPGWELLQDWTFVAHGGGAHTIPAGFWFDGGSVPAAFWQITYTPHDPRMVQWALPHDWAYCSRVISRYDADRTLADGLAQHGTIRAELVRAAVRTFGSIYWQDSDRDKAFMTHLRACILTSGRSLARYGL